MEQHLPSQTGTFKHHKPGPKPENLPSLAVPSFQNPKTRSIKPQCSTVQKFERFARLPLELQNEIWDLALPRTHVNTNITFQIPHNKPSVIIKSPAKTINVNHTTKYPHEIIHHHTYIFSLQHLKLTISENQATGVMIINYHEFAMLAPYRLCVREFLNHVWIKQRQHKTTVLKIKGFGVNEEVISVAEDKDPLLMFLGSCWGLEKVVLVMPRFCLERVYEEELDRVMKMVEGRMNGVESWVRDKNWRWVADVVVTRSKM